MTRRIRFLVLYLSLLLLVLAVVFELSLMFPAGEAFTWNRNEVVNV